MVGTLIPPLVAGGRVGRLGPFLLAALVMAPTATRSAPVKRVAQIVLAPVLIQFDFFLRLSAYPVLNVFLTVFRVVGITNAFNLLDNMGWLPSPARSASPSS